MIIHTGTYVRNSIVLVLACLFISGRAIAGSDTTFIRELAKNRPQVVIITSGPQSAELGQSLLSSIQRHPDNKHKADEITAISLAQADAVLSAINDPKSKGMSTIFLLLEKEMPAEPSSAVMGALPIRISGLPQHLSLLKCEKLRDVKKGLGFNVVMMAPDKPRLERMFETFLGRSAGHYDSLIPFSQAYRTNRIDVFSSQEDAGAVRNWGALNSGVSRADLGSPDVWNDIKPYMLDERAKLTPDQLEECAEVYFIDRSRNDLSIPEPALKLLADVSLKETSIIVKRGVTEAGRTIIVFSAPNSILLRAKADRYKTIESVPGNTILDNVQDLRHIGATTLVVWGNGPSDADKEQIRSTLAKDIRENLKVRVEERGDILKLLDKEIATQELLGATDTAKMLRSKNGLRYIWIFRITGYTGSTEYKASESKISTDEIPAYPEAEPRLQIDSVGGGRKDEIARKKPIWERDHAEWERRKGEYERNAQRELPIQFERILTQVSSGQVTGVLQLVDLKNSREVGAVVWEHDCQGLDGTSKQYNSDRVTLRGIGNRPSSLEAPPSESRCAPELVMNAARNAGNKAIKVLQETAWLPDGTVPSEEPKSEVAAESTSAPKTIEHASQPMALNAVNQYSSKVAQIKGNTLILKIDPSAGIRVGDKVEIGIKIDPVADPDDPSKALRWDVIEKSTLRVILVSGETADCVPANADEAKKTGRIKPGMPVVKTYRPTVIKPVSVNTNKHVGKK